MNCSEAKKIPIVGYLASQGIKPEKVKNGAIWYCSPLRNEKKPSFKVDRNYNIWYDYGLGKVGNILDLVMTLNNTGISGALLLLQKPELSKQSFSFSEQHSIKQPGITINHIQPLQNRALLQYLNERKITQQKANRYIQEAYYSIDNKSFFALAFKNDKNGYELRNKYFKGSCSPKAITTITGINKTTVNIFEGFMDFLSALERFNTTKPKCNIIALNSLSNLENTLDKIKSYNKINLFLDNDSAGNEAKNKIETACSNVTDYAKIIYPNNKDFNEYLLK